MHGAFDHIESLMLDLEDNIRFFSEAQKKLKVLQDKALIRAMNDDPLDDDLKNQIWEAESDMKFAKEEFEKVKQKIANLVNSIRFPY